MKTTVRIEKENNNSYLLMTLENKTICCLLESLFKDFCITESNIIPAENGYHYLFTHSESEIILYNNLLNTKLTIFSFYYSENVKMDIALYSKLFTTLGYKYILRIIDGIRNYYILHTDLESLVNWISVSSICGFLIYEIKSNELIKHQKGIDLNFMEFFNDWLLLNDIVFTNELSITNGLYSCSSISHLHKMSGKDLVNIFLNKSSSIENRYSNYYELLSNEIKENFFGDKDKLFSSVYKQFKNHIEWCE